MENRFRAAFDEVLSGVQDALADGKLDFGELMALMYKVTRAGVRIVEGVKELTPQDELEAVLAWEELFDAHIAPLDIPWIPQFLEKRVVDPLLKRAGANMIAAAFEELRNRTG